MKTLLPLFLILAMAISSPAELLTNPGFESGDLTGWSIFGPEPSWTVEGGDNAFSGNFGVVNTVHNSQVGENWRGVYQNVPVTEGQLYSATVFIRALDVESSESWLEINWRNENGDNIGQSQSARVTADQPFTRATLPWITAPAGAVTANVNGIVFMADLPAENADFHAFDDFSMKEMPVNQADNPGFEDEENPLEGWETFGVGWRTGGGDDARSGQYGLVNDVLDWQVGEEWRGVFRSVPVTGGETYSAGVFIRAVSANHSESWFELQWLDDVGDIIDQLQTPPVTSDQPFTYTALENIVAPANAVAASIRGIVHMTDVPTADDADFHIFDDFFMVLEAEPEPEPILEIATGDGNDILVSWPTFSTGFELESTPELVAPDWQPVGVPPVEVEGRWQVAIPALDAQAFFRLRKP